MGGANRRAGVETCTTSYPLVSVSVTVLDQNCSMRMRGTSILISMLFWTTGIVAETGVWRLAGVILVDRDGAEVQNPNEAEVGDVLVVAGSAPRRPCPGLNLNFDGRIFAGSLQRRLGSRCAVVGSSGARGSKGYGREIDAHDTVIRLNENPVGNEFEADIGRKTTVRIGTVVNKKNHHTLLGAGAQRGYGVVRYHWPWTQHLREVARCKPEDTPCHLLSEDFLHHAAHVVGSVIPGGSGVQLANKLQYTDKGRVTSLKPSTGFIAVLLALYTCDSVDLYGFQLCARDDPRATPICSKRGDIAQSSQRYFCKYYDYGDGWRSDRCSHFDHVFDWEHTVYDKLNACNLLTRHWGAQ